MAPIQRESYGVEESGVTKYTLVNGQGAQIQVLDYGAYLISWTIKDKNGQLVDILLGYDCLEDYKSDGLYVGAPVGRVANQIPGGKFKMDGQEYQLSINWVSNGNHIHGGIDNFSKKMWRLVEANEADNSLTLALREKHGENGYPGTLDTTMRYQFCDNGELRISYTANTDMKTIVNLSQHSYFNLTGEGTRTLHDHTFQIHADKYISYDGDYVLNGQQQNVQGTNHDLRQPVTAAHVEPDKIVHSAFYCLSDKDDHKMRPVASEFMGTFSVRSSTTGLKLEVSSDQPAVQFHTCSNFSVASGKGGKPYPPYSAFCFETQGYTVSLFHPQYPPITLEPSETYKATMVYKLTNDN